MAITYYPKADFSAITVNRYAAGEGEGDIYSPGTMKVDLKREVARYLDRLRRFAGL
jgi:hypothetical protein